MMDLDALAERVRDAIPLTRHLDFTFAGFDGLSLVVTAPLGPNHNDKGTFFAGSQSALLTLEYKFPLDGDLQITASISEEDRERFAQRLSRRGKATLRIHAKGTDVDGKVVCLYQGLYLART